MIKETRIIMGMPVTIMSPESAALVAIQKAFEFFEYTDQTYSPFIETSAVSKINRGELSDANYSDELREILDLAEMTKHQTNGYFDVWHDGTFDPSGIVKGWAIQHAATILRKTTKNFYVEAGGDIQANGTNDKSQPWRIGVRNPFNRHENIVIVALDNHAIATSGTAIRGQHIYNPVDGNLSDEIVSLTVIAPNIVDADRMATAAFAMGRRGIDFIETLAGYEGYVVGTDKRATMTSGWKKFEVIES